jgi:hypothetical protein
LAKIKAVLDKAEFDALSDALKELYTEKNGKYVLDSDHEDITSLKTTVANLREEKSTAEKELAKWKDVDPVKAREALTKVQELEEAEAKKSGEWDKLKTQMVQRHQTELADANGKVKEKDAHIERLTVDKEINAALADPDLKVLSVKALFPHVKAKVKAVLEGDQYVAIVHDGQGNPRVADGSGQPMTIKQLAAEMAKDGDYAPLFGSKSKGGSGTPSQGAAAGSQQQASTISKSDIAGASSRLDEIASGKLVVND